MEKISHYPVANIKENGEKNENFTIKNLVKSQVHCFCVRKRVVYLTDEFGNNKAPSDLSLIHDNIVNLKS